MTLEFTNRPAASRTVIRYTAELTVWTGEQGHSGGHVYVNVWCTHEHEKPAQADACRDRIRRFLTRRGAAGLEELGQIGAAC